MARQKLFHFEVTAQIFYAIKTVPMLSNRDLGRGCGAVAEQTLPTPAIRDSKPSIG